MKRAAAVLALVAVAGCGTESGTHPFDKNHDGIVGACEGLSRSGCAATPGCRVEELACIALCVDDGHGGCRSACPSDFECLPVAPPACEQLTAAQCANDPRCIAAPLACDAVCEEDGRGGCKPCEASACQTRPMLDCGSVPVAVCPLLSDCRVETVTVCSGAARGGGATPEVDHGECGGPPSGCTTLDVCTNRIAPPPPSPCEQLTEATCLSNPACELEQEPVCEVACLPGAECPPCATPHARCVQSSHDVCGERDEASCEVDGRCVSQPVYCALVCEDDGKGGCKPCPGSTCVAAHPLPDQPAPPPIR